MIELALLVVDHNVARREVRTDLLRRSGIRVVEAATAFVALRRTAEHEFVLALLSGRLPDLEMPELCRQLRTKAPRTLLLCLESVESAGWDGADIYLREPLAPEELIATISTCVRLCRRDAEAAETLGAALTADVCGQGLSTVAAGVGPSAADSNAGPSLHNDIDSVPRRNVDLHEVMRLAGVGSWEWDAETDTFTWSAELFRIFGRDPANPAPSYAEHSTLYSPESMARLADAVDRALSFGEPYKVELEVLRPDGLKCWAVSRGEPRYDAQARIVGLRGTLQDITEQKQAREELSQRLAEIEAIYSTAPIGLCVLDADCRYLRINRFLAEINGVPLEEHCGKTLRTVVPNIAAKAEALVRRVIETGEPILNLEMCGETPREPGTPRYFNFHLYPLKQGGNTCAVNIVTEEITDRTRIEAALRASEERLRFILACSKAGAWELDSRTGIFIISEEVNSIFGFPLDTRNLTQEQWLGRVHPDDRAELAQAWREDLKNYVGQVCKEYRIIHPEHGVRWISGWAGFKRDDAGRLVRTGGISFDITDRKRREERIRFQARLLDAVEQAIAVNDLDWKITYWNRFAEKLYGWRAEEVMGQDVKKLLAPEFTDRQRRELLAALQSGAPVTGELVVRHKDGHAFPILTTDSPVYDDQGHLAYVIGISVDLTERKKAEENLRALNESLCLADRRKNEFLAMLAHELRNPLAPIRNIVRILRNLEPGETRTMDWARDVIERQVSHLARLVDDLLDVSRLVSGRIELKKEIVDLADAVEHALEVVRPLIQDRRHDLVVNLPDGDLRLNADPNRLIQVLENLLTNAAKYTPPGGKLRFEAVREDGKAVIRIRDNGMGIPPDLLPHVFDLFTQSPRSLDRSQGGLGIGLTIVKKLIEMHDGEIAVRSDGQGTEFTVALPLSPVGSPDRVQPDKPADGLRHGAGAARRILVVDDNEDACNSLALLLRLEGHEVQEASDGPSALALAKAFRPEVVLLDIGLPGIDGYEVAQCLRERPETREALLVAVTGYGQAEDRLRARNAGFRHHLVKPVDLHALGRLISAEITEQI